MRKNSVKNTRINAEVQRELSTLIREECKDPRIHPLTSVVAAEVAPDLKTAKIYISVFPFDKAQATLQLIEQNAKLIRGALGNRMRNQVKSIPELQFFIDDSLEYIENIDSLLKK